MKCGRHQMPISWFAGRYQCVGCAAIARAEQLPDLIGPIVDRLVSEASA